MELNEFLKYAESGPVVPVFRELSADTLTPVTAFLRLRRRGEPGFLFESVEGGARVGRYSFLGRDPFQRLWGRVGRAGGKGGGAGEVVLERVDSGYLRAPRWGPRSSAATLPQSRSLRLDGGFFKALHGAVAEFPTVHVPNLPPLTGGAVGYIGYDAVRWIEALPDRHAPENSLPDADFFFYDTLAAFDHARHRIYLIANVRLDRSDRGREALERAFKAANMRLDEWEEDLERPLARRELPRLVQPLERELVSSGMESNFTQADFESAVLRAKEYIAAGDAFQIVLSQRFRKRVRPGPFEIYRALRTLNPSPYLFYVEWGDTALIGSSPETMVRVENRRAMVRPIAGTRRRGRDDEEDLQLEEELLADEKELAEHRMLVDLGRNDIGRVARFGTVSLPRREEIERYSHVMHIVSQVEGELREDLSATDAFCAGFPAGTVSGAPKIRAMEIIDELEPTRRGTYAGAVGYLDFAGNLDTSIAIRTMLLHQGEAFLQAGGGIVADSVPEREYFETIHKASALYDAVRLADAARGQGID